MGRATPVAIVPGPVVDGVAAFSVGSGAVLSTKLFYRVGHFGLVPGVTRVVFSGRPS